MKKKLGILLLAASMLTFATACGDKKEDKTEATTEATTAATEAETTEAAAQTNGERVELDKFHGIFTVTYDPALYKEPEPSDLADLIGIDPTKNTNLFIATLDGLDFVEEKLDNLKKLDDTPEEIKVGDYTGYLFEYDDDFMGHSLEYIISLEDEVKSSDGYYNNVSGIYIHGSDNNKDAIANDEFRAIIDSVKIGDFSSSSDDSDDSSTDDTDDSKEADSETHDDYGKSNPEATGIVSFDKLKETFDWLHGIEMGTYPTYEECKEHFGADGAPWWDGAFDDERHAYKWETENGDFLYITFKVDNGQETYSSYTWSSSLND